MSKSETVRARVEPKLKRGAEAVLKKLGLTSSEAITLFYAQVKLTKGLPTTGDMGRIAVDIYKNGTTLNDVRQGNNGSFAASGAWDACTGLGSPIGTKLANVL